MSSSPSFLSPVSSDESMPPDGPVVFADLSHLTKLVVKTTPARADGLAPAFGASESTGDALVCGTRPGEWTVIGPADAALAAVAGSSAPRHRPHPRPGPAGGGR